MEWRWQGNDHNQHYLGYTLRQRIVEPLGIQMCQTAEWRLIQYWKGPLSSMEDHNTRRNGNME